jgi:pilus assembly protein CpaF
VSGYHDEAFHDDDHVVRTLTKLLDDASSSHRKLDPAEGLQDAQLDDGARLHIVHRDVGRGSHLLVNIRRFTGVAFRSLDELVERGMLTGQVAAFLRRRARPGCRSCSRGHRARARRRCCRAAPPSSTRPCGW